MIGSIANNRFLQRVSPEITRALADSGSSLEHSEIQQLMRQMVDLNIADNLKLWVHSGLVKTRTSGSDTFVPKAYDISSNDNDGVQATEASQPKLVSLGMEFDGSNDWLDMGESDTSLNTDYCTYMLWISLSVLTGSGSLHIINRHNTSPATVNITYFSDTSSFYSRIRTAASPTGANDLNSGITPTLNVFYHLALTFNGINGRYYVNGDEKNSFTISATTLNKSDFKIITVSKRGTNNDSYFTGILNDTRIFNSALSATEITAIYNATKAKYGH